MIIWAIYDFYQRIMVQLVDTFWFISSHVSSFSLCMCWEKRINADLGFFGASGCFLVLVFFRMLPFDDLPSMCFCDGEAHLFVACFSFIPFFIMVSSVDGGAASAGWRSVLFLSPWMIAADPDPCTACWMCEGYNCYLTVTPCRSCRARFISLSFTY